MNETKSNNERTNLKEVLDHSLAEIDAQQSLSADQKTMFKEALKNYAKGNTSFAKAAQVPPDFLEMIYGYGYQLFMSGQYEKACLLFDILVLFNRTESRYNFAMAACYHKQKRYEEAAKYYFEAAAYDPENPLIYYYLYDCLLHSKQKELALGVLTFAFYYSVKDVRFKKLSYQIELEYLKVLNEQGSRASIKK